MSIKPSLHLCFIIVIKFLIRCGYSSEFHVISTTEKQTQKNEDVGLKLCLTFVETKLEVIEQLLEHIRRDHKNQQEEMLKNEKKLKELESRIMEKIENKTVEKNEKFFELLNQNLQLLQNKTITIEEQLKELDNRIIEKIESKMTKSEEQEISYKQQLQEEILANRNQLQKAESNIIDTIEKSEKSFEKKHQEGIIVNQKQQEILQNQIITNGENFCTKHQAEMIQKNVSHILEKISQTLYPIKLPENCKSISQMESNPKNGVFSIRPKKSKNNIDVLCDFTTRGGGWTYIMNRFDGSQDFFLGWEDYKKGFGSLSGEFWLGLENLYLLTKDSNNELLVELEDWDGDKTYALYNNFKLGDEHENYKLKILGKYSGNAGDALEYHRNMDFQTKDRGGPNDCPNEYKGAWWFDNCYYSHLNGPYLKENVNNNGMTWQKFRSTYSLKKAWMMIRQS